MSRPIIDRVFLYCNVNLQVLVTLFKKEICFCRARVAFLLAKWRHFIANGVYEYLVRSELPANQLGNLGNFAKTSAGLFSVS